MSDELKVKAGNTSSTPWVQDDKIIAALERYKIELQNELSAILSWWTRTTLDEKNGGFAGRVDHFNKTNADAPKGSVLNSRILWAFSSAYSFTSNEQYLQIATRAFNYVIEYFIDKDFGGVYWTVDFRGRPLEERKQVYALAFAIYGLAEYYHVSKNELALQHAVGIYNQIVHQSYDEENGGYIEAFTREWLKIDDMRLSAKDANEKKSMNTHLHLLEAFTNLYKMWRDESLRKRIIELIQVFLKHIIDFDSNHLVLFFDEKWNAKSTIVSYGHDVEAAWLIVEAAKVAGARSMLDEVRNMSVKLAQAATKGLDGDGGLWYEYDPSCQRLTREKHSWPQAEAMIGFFNAWQITRDQEFLTHSLQSWEFVKQHMIDNESGEWYWGVNWDHSPMIDREKAGLWKCPYHNTRACMEIGNRVNTLIKNQ